MDIVMFLFNSATVFKGDLSLFFETHDYCFAATYVHFTAQCKILKDSACAKNVFNNLLKKILKRKIHTFYVSNQCCHLKAICF